MPGDCRGSLKRRLRWLGLRVRVIQGLDERPRELGRLVKCSWATPVFHVASFLWMRHWVNFRAGRIPIAGGLSRRTSMSPRGTHSSASRRLRGGWWGPRWAASNISLGSPGLPPLFSASLPPLGPSLSPPDTEEGWSDQHVRVAPAQAPFGSRLIIDIESLHRESI